MKIDLLKANRGVSMVDIVIALTILCIFAGTIGSIYYAIALNNGKVQFSAIATYIVVQIAEDIDKMPYEQVTNENLNNKLNNSENGYKYPEQYEIEISVDEADNENRKEDILKIVEINVKYNVLNADQMYSIKKLKIKEI